LPNDEEREYMTTVSKENEVVTLINVFTVKPENQQQLVDLLIEATEKTMKNLQGFVSANIHKSFDGTRVVNYAQWRRVEDFEAIKQNPEARPHMQAAAALAEFDPILCEVIDSIGIDD
jgi:quinol monooxygenase YgiN